MHPGDDIVFRKTVEYRLTSRKTVAVTGVSDTEHSEPGSPAGGSDQGELSDRDTPQDEGLDQELSEEANYRETIKGVRSFMGWHQILDFDSSSPSSLEPSLPGKYPSSYRQMNGFAESWKSLTSPWLTVIHRGLMKVLDC